MQNGLDDAALDLLFREAHTAYTFAETPLPDDVLVKLWELVRDAPSQVNSQPLRIVEVRSAAAREQLAGLLIPSNRPKTVQAPLTAILAADLHFDRLLDELFPAHPGVSRFFGDDHIRESTALMNACIQVGYVLIGVRALGLAVGPMAGYDREGLNRTFFPDGRLRGICVINIGYPGPAAFFPRSPRLAAASAVSQV